MRINEYENQDLLFGGARPRELVLKERGIDEIVIKPDLGDALSSVNISKNEATSERLVPSPQHNKSTDNLAHEKRTGKKLERREQQMGRGKDDNQGRNNWVENRWSSRDAEKKQQQQQEDQKTEADTWRKPIEEEKLAPNDASGIHHGKIVSSVDLARAFSKSVSDPTHEQSSAQRGLPGHNNQMPFSRLTDTRQLSKSRTARPHLNGY